MKLVGANEWQHLLAIQQRYQQVLVALRALEVTLRREADELPGPEKSQSFGYGVQQASARCADRLAALVKEHGG